MPLPSDPELLKVSKDLVEALHSTFGKHPGFRAGMTVIVSPSYDQGAVSSKR